MGERQRGERGQSEFRHNPGVETHRRDVERERNTERERYGARERAHQEQQRAEKRRRNSERATRERLDQERRSEEQRGQRRTEHDLAGNPHPRREQLAQSRERLSGEQRDRLRGAFDRERARVAHPDFDWRVGHHVPRKVRLFPIPVAVIGFLPYYRDYRYFVVEDEVCIVDPSTYEVVDVIDEAYLGRPHRQIAALSLSPSQIAVLRNSIPPDFPVTELHLRLALGAEIPDEATLHAFPDIVLDRAPELQHYRFLIAEDEIVIVDPRDRSIALVVDR
jgi:hypothetical protein